MKKESSKRRTSIDFSKGIRGKYANTNLKIVGPTNSEENARVVLKKVSRVLNSAGSSKHDLEAAIARARDLISSNVRN